jgi:hypothetical protein
MNSFEWIFCFLPVGALSFYLFETLTKRMEKTDPLKWANEGTQAGGLLPSYDDSKSETIKKRYLTGKLAIKWFFTVPKWIKEQKDNTITILWAYKISSLICFIAMAVWISCSVYKSWF